ncbi:MAG: hypothetical protein KAI83_02545 [Thiomargarita sp.]|nr:hypothetical protein [Thiomargarita sp.]
MHQKDVATPTWLSVPLHKSCPPDLANAIKLSQGEHAGSPLQAQNTWRLVGADLCVCP